MTADLVDQIDALLPQTQCTKCGFSGCRPYAEAIAAGNATSTGVRPAAPQVIAKLAALLGSRAKPLNPVFGTEQPRAAALIDEHWCIGCTLCIQACPVDAIVGAPKLMHTVLLEHCTGCELCFAALPGGLHRDGRIYELACAGRRIPDTAPNNARRRRERGTSCIRRAVHASAKQGKRDWPRRPTGVEENRGTQPIRAAERAAIASSASERANARTCRAPKGGESPSACGGRIRRCLQRCPTRFATS